MPTVNLSRNDQLNYAVPELAQRLGMSRNSVYAAIRRGEIPHIRLHGRIIIPRVAVDEWLRSAVARVKAS